MAATNLIWTPRLDAALLRGIVDGLSTSKIAAKLGPRFTKNMIVGRHKRLRGIVSPCERRRRYEARQRAAKLARARAKFVAQQVSIFERRIARGEPESRVIAKAHRAGLSLRSIGGHVGLSHEQVRQICKAEGRT